jgi:flagellar basal-body rod protein FlgF
VKKLISGIYKLVDGSLVQKVRFDTISNNLANISTNGFKKDIISFHQILSMKNSSTTDFSPGAVRYTGNELDVALESPGFFKIQTPKGMRYTRDGAFKLDADRTLVTHNGDPVLGENGPITINGGNVIIDRDGRVVTDNEPAGTISVVDFRNPELLRKEGSSYYVYQGEKKDIFTAEKIDVQNGYIEQSNVNSTVEMVKMVEALRVFESAQKAIQCMDEIASKMVNEVGRLQ